jgi:hypothetical protein
VGGKYICPVWKTEEADCEDCRIDAVVAPVSPELAAAEARLYQSVSLEAYSLIILFSKQARLGYRGINGLP